MRFSICLIFLVQQVFSGLLVGLAQQQQPSGFISLSCGSPLGGILRDEETNIKYTTDADFINTGVGKSIKSSHRSQSEQQTWYVRSFPQGIRNCYNLNLTRGDKYLIRTTFRHGGYDDNPSTQFDLHLGPNRWATVSTASESKSKTFEMIHQLTTDRLQVCLVKTHDSTPFISALELRKLNSEAYKTNTPTKSLQTIFRADIGALSNQPLRYREDENGAYIYRTDVYDRIWSPYNCENWSQIRTSNSVDKNNSFKPPEEVMFTASVSTDPYAPMSISLPGLDQTSPVYIVMHFSEIQDVNSNDTREIHFMYNGRHIGEPIKPKRLYTHTQLEGEELGPNVNGKYIISLQRTAESTLPPLLNALEFYMVKSLPQKETDQKEVDAMMKIKSRYGVNRTFWEGDPCAPQDYRWDGINCSYKHDQPPKIISLNLTSSGLVGEILDSISNLTNLQVLDLSDNNLNGSVPEFLANMKTLKLIVQSGSVSLRFEGNDNLCFPGSCADTDDKKTIIVVVTSIVLIFIIAASTLLVLNRMRKGNSVSNPTSDDINLEQTDESSCADMANTYECLVQATDNFSSTNLIGQGGLGHVYRGLLPDGTQVAIKKLKSASQQGEREFQAEIEIVGRVHHKHLVSLIGYCISGSERLLVYEFVPNKTLEFHLHEKGSPVLNWTQRKQIALGAARGLAYLHEDCSPRTIHRDVKAANILVDDSYEAKLADFGLAKCCLETETHVSTRIMGTFGYLAPEYASSGKLTDKSDVFSFGVVLVELITGRRPNSQEETITDWAKPRITKALNDGDFSCLVDPRLEDDFEIVEMRTMVACASASICYSAKRRPKMSQIARALEGTISLDDLNDCSGSGSSDSGQNSIIIEGQQ